MSTLKFERCPQCGAKSGELHRLGCDVEPCPRCGQQPLICNHYLFGAVHAPPDEERIMWTGELPGHRECREFGFFYKHNPDGQGTIRCGPDEPGSLPDFNRLHTEAVWDRERKRFVRKEDRSVAKDGE